MADTLHEGWVILTFADREPLAGMLRYEKVGELFQWVLDVPASHRHRGYVAIIDPLAIKTVTPCTDTEAVKFISTRAPLREPPAA